MRVGGLVLGCFLVLGCSSEPELKPAPQESAGPQPPFRTDAASYAWGERDSMFVAAIPFSYHNATPDTIYIVNCNGHLPFALEREVGGVWIPFWMSGTNACLSPPIPIAPGDTFRNVADVAILPANGELPPGTTRADLGGTYRLAWHSLRHRFHQSPPLGDTLPGEARRSSAFELR